MLTGLVHVKRAFPLRVAAAMAGVDIEFGPTATVAPYQRVDVLSSDQRARDILRRYKVVLGTPKKGKQFKESDPTLLNRPKLRSSKES